eukprot:CAMPEP_0173448806 /NCGR_PEP_ID=MMETSP1357-20121228/41522_1 /TAXON_ID=77926 /ORGANISM="Hemiselmis rufescens, Strain PCC563" /LENGTH=56 /DNA_ID=CAMNT_0014415345 /DNA_START=6 /DNA_END=173 /DNA_ORIENTATION=+
MSDDITEQSGDIDCLMSRWERVPHTTAPVMLEARVHSADASICPGVMDGMPQGSVQ